MLQDVLTGHLPPTATDHSGEDEHLTIDGFVIQVSVQPAATQPPDAERTDQVE